MANIELERNQGGMSWLWWVLGLLALILILWWIWPDSETELGVVDEPMESVEPVTTPEPVATMAGVTIGDILGSPDGFIDGSFPGAEVMVVEVPTDRGFWIEDEGERLFAIVIDQPQEEFIDINPGQTLRIDQGMLRDRTFLPEIPGAPLDAATQAIAEQQDIFLVVDEAQITILEEGEPQAGTDPTQGVQPNG